MQYLLKLYEATKKIKNDLTQYQFSTDFLNKKRSYFASLKQRNLYPSHKTLVQLSIPTPIWLESFRPFQILIH